MLNHRFTGTFALAALGAASFVGWDCSSSDPGSAKDAGATDATAAGPTVDSGGKNWVYGDANDPNPNPTPVPTGTGPAPGPGPVGWKSVVGFAGFFSQTFDDASWASKTIANVSLYAVACHGNLIGWAAGEKGYIAHTVDGGLTWTSQRAHLATDFRAIHFGSETLGVVAGDAGALAVTSDGGATWNVVAARTQVPLRGAAVAGDVGVMIVVGDHGTVLRSADEGASWTRATIAGAGDLHGVSMDDGAHVVLAVDALGGIWSSIDAGVTFVREMATSEPLDGIATSDDGTRALAVGHGGLALVRSPQGTWATVVTGTTSDLHTALITDHNTRYYVAGEAGTLLTSTNLGSSWIAKPLGTSVALYGLEDF